MQTGLPEEKSELDSGGEPLFVAPIIDPSRLFSMWALNRNVLASISNLKLTADNFPESVRPGPNMHQKITEGKMRQNSRFVKSARGADQECALTFALWPL